MFSLSRFVARQAMLWFMVISMLVQPPLAALAQTESLSSDPTPTEEPAPTPSESIVVPEEVAPPVSEESAPVDPSLENSPSSPVDSGSVEPADAPDAPVHTEEQISSPAQEPELETIDALDIDQATTTLEEKQMVEVLSEVVSTTPPMHPSAYQFLMRSANQLDKGESLDTNGLSLPTDKAGMAKTLRSFIETEKERLDEFDIPAANKRKYLWLLRQQAHRLEPEQKGWFAKMSGAIGDFFGSDGELGYDGLKIEEPQELPEAEIPEHPARFEMADDNIPVVSLSNTQVRVAPTQKISTELRSLVQVQAAEATDTNEPVIEDITPDSHTALTPEIVTLATELQFDPVLITNYVRNTITYAPYYGAKKGAAGCLREQVCNDVDTASLTIALLRASGIPAQYKKEIAVLPIEQLKNFLGVDETRTVFAAFGLNKVSIYPIIDHPEGETLETADFTADTHFALEWVHPQVYLVYDEQMGIVPAGLPLFPDTVTTTEAVRSALLSHPQARDLQWVPVDVVFQPSVRNRNTIAHDSAAFDMRDFWNRFLQYSGTLSPVEKYRQELQSATGIDINSVSSSVRETDTIFDTMPPVLPYLTGSGVTGSGVPITMETFSILPGRYDYDVTVSLKHKDGGEVVFAHTFTGIEINNTPFEVRYEGATEGDQAVIESYGGLHATPATLVSIVPNFVGGAFTHTGETALSIGDELVLGFEYARDGTSLYTNEKFSIAGNTEGVFITLHGLSTTEAVDDLSNPDRASEILLLGNAAIAREYLRVAFAEADRVADGLDYVYSNVFARAVVTQNRTLSRVEGTPTTFDFSGLSLDASTLITDYSRRSDFRTHRQDFRLLFGLSSSYYEGQFFTDLTSLTGISTVQGLQYAYANPGTYTVHTITSSNESVIDSLALSNNTKANMHTDVAAGNTIITPDKYVEQGAFRGILYISLDPEGTGSYAIGEQVQNGGFTMDSFGQITVIIDGKFFGQFKNIGTGTKVFVYANNFVTSDKRCSIDRSIFDSLIDGGSGWQESYGLPCMKEVINFDGQDHTMILTTNAARFSSSVNGYSEWVTEKSIVNTIKLVFPSETIDVTKVFPYWGTYTYAKGSPLWTNRAGITALAVYNPKNRAVYTITDSLMVQKYVSVNKIVGKYVPELLGYPVGNMGAAVRSLAETEGTYQPFMNGQMYWVDKTWPSPNQVYVVYGTIGRFYNADENMRNGYRGTGGVFGYPTSDPFLSGTAIQQKFEEAIVQAGTPSQILSQTKEGRRAQIKEVALKFLDEVVAGRITDVEAFAKIANYISAKRGISTDDFVKDLAIIFIGADTIYDYGFSVGWGKVGVDAFSPYQVKGFSDTGFAFKYNDSHYCVDGRQECISNQLFHSMLGFNYAYFHGKKGADKKTKGHDSPYSPLAVSNETGKNLEDLNLGFHMATLGEELANGIISKTGVGDWILENIADTSYVSKRMSQSNIKSLATYKKRFRVFEYERNGNVDKKWVYSSDMGSINCSDEKLYYQNYDQFILNNINVKKSVAIWSERLQKMVFLHGSNLTYYQPLSSVCSHIDTLSSSAGFSLTRSFSQMVNEIIENYD